MKRSKIFFALIFAGTMFFAGQAAAIVPTSNQVSTLSINETDKEVLQKASEKTGIAYQDLEELYNRGEVEVLPSFTGKYEMRVLDADGNPVISVVVSEL